MSAPAATDVPTGNTFDKYGSSNPVVRRLMAGFHATLDELWARAAPRSLLDVGCGEGVLTLEWARRLGDGRVVGIDLEDPKLRGEWAARTRPNLEFRAEEATRAFVRGRRVRPRRGDRGARARARAGGDAGGNGPGGAAGWLLVSVPREPLWRALNMARGAYVRDLGNTPGHVNHWSKRAFESLLSRYGTVEEARSPFPWTMLLVRVG